MIKREKYIKQIRSFYDSDLVRSILLIDDDPYLMIDISSNIKKLLSVE